jgi:hypothetical protein
LLGSCEGVMKISLVHHKSFRTRKSKQILPGHCRVKELINFSHHRIGYSNPTPLWGDAGSEPARQA